MPAVGAADLNFTRFPNARKAPEIALRGPSGVPETGIEPALP